MPSSDLLPTELKNPHVQEPHLNMASAANVLIKNRKVIPCQFATAGEFIRSIPPTGVYSTCRTIGQTAIVDLKTQIERLSKVQIQDTKAFEQTIICCLSLVVHHFNKRYKDAKDQSSETRITISVTQSSESDVPDILAYGETLPPIPKPPIRVDIRAGERENPQVKSTQWVQDRQKFNLLKTPDVEEIVLFDDNGDITEGLTSNFGVIMKGKWQTAPNDKVLRGTVLEHILDVVEKMSIPIERKCPNIKDINDWDAAFISSTSRLCLPINQLVLPDPPPQSQGTRRDFTEYNLFEQVNSRVLQMLAQSATQIPVMEGAE